MIPGDSVAGCALFFYESVKGAWQLVHAQFAFANAPP